jgi:C4-type Zn-finger protein
MECPKCWQTNSITIYYIPHFNAEKPYMLVCYNCGWTSHSYKTKTEAMLMGGNNE